MAPREPKRPQQDRGPEVVQAQGDPQDEKLPDHGRRGGSLGERPVTLGVQVRRPAENKPRTRAVALRIRAVQRAMTHPRRVNVGVWEAVARRGWKRSTLGAQPSSV